MLFDLKLTADRFGFRRFGVSVIIATLSLQTYVPAFAANNAFSAVADVNTLDYVANVDWDFDNPPTQIGNSSVTLNKAWITSMLTVFARSNFTMTEGLHKVGTVYVYKNSLFGTNVDIQVINKDGRSNASPAGWQKGASWTSHNYLAMSGAPSTLDEVAKVITHEMGHYTYTLHDEYQEQGKALNPADVGGAADIDTPRNTIMNNHLQFQSLSTPADYIGDGITTAQKRVSVTGSGNVGASAWEVLTRTVDKDGELLKSFGRTFFEAFRGIDPAKMVLTRPVTGFDSKLNIVFVSNPVFRDIILVDSTLPAPRLASQVQAAKTMIAQSKADSQYMILASPATGAAPIMPFTIADTAGKAALSAALDTLTTATSGNFDSIASFTQAFRALAAVRRAGDPSTIHMFIGSESSFPADAVTVARTARVAINGAGVTGGTSDQPSLVRGLAKAQSTTGNVVSLAQLAGLTGGAFRQAKDGTEAAKNAIRSMNEAHGQSGGTLAISESNSMAPSTVFNTPFSMASGAVDGNVTIELVFEPADASKLKVSLSAPNGAIYSPSNLPAGISLNDDSVNGLLQFIVDPSFSGRVGNWTLGVNASAQTQNGIGVEVTTDSKLNLSAHIEGGTAGSAIGPKIKAVLGSDKQVRGALVTANVYNVDGTLALGNVTLLDDGIGQYTANLSGKLPAGQYTVTISAKTVPGSRTAAIGAPIKGPFNVETEIDPLTRVAESSFTLDSGATGVGLVPPAAMVVASLVNGSSGGGCTVSADGRDAGLVLLLLSALVGLALRRSRTAVPLSKA